MSVNSTPSTDSTTGSRLPLAVAHEEVCIYLPVGWLLDGRLTCVGALYGIRYFSRMKVMHHYHTVEFAVIR